MKTKEQYIRKYSSCVLRVLFMDVSLGNPKIAYACTQLAPQKGGIPYRLKLSPAELTRTFWVERSLFILLSVIYIVSDILFRSLITSSKLVEENMKL